MRTEGQVRNASPCHKPCTRTRSCSLRTTLLDSMASNELTTATLRFLTDAGHLLAAAAPETSAYLMSRRSDLMFEHEVPLSDKQRQSVCSCCGHIMVLGNGSHLQVKPGRRPSKKLRPDQRSKAANTTRRPQSQTACGPTKAITCGRCGGVTEVKLPAPGMILRRKAKPEKGTKSSGPAVSSGLSSAAQEMSSQKATSNASSKKRAKSRKAGLQALLNQPSTSRPGLGLSLADFMAKK